MFSIHHLVGAGVWFPLFLRLGIVIFDMLVLELVYVPIFSLIPFWAPGVILGVSSPFSYCFQALRPLFLDSLYQI